eukprot:CAMPEP_0195291160 /NCGR_PEP_ID=MMETSP0707-20130614/7245_1 /TAXON_ID=33640 /ORGANISM="Asterionellopsis glacialis, Strain CCMP134" /LENGTH=253 /DNA_ID=CAMNT_0040351423 /DNA_START=57 /DNA_END=818 /DNA_ORIENTATION=+
MSTEMKNEPITTTSTDMLDLVNEGIDSAVDPFSVSDSSVAELAQMDTLNLDDDISCLLDAPLPTSEQDEQCTMDPLDHRVEESLNQAMVSEHQDPQDTDDDDDDDDDDKEESHDIFFDSITSLHKTKSYRKPDRSPSPPRKRRSIKDESVSSLLSESASAILSESSRREEDLQYLEYKASLAQLNASMKRSAYTREQIRRQKKLAEAEAGLGHGRSTRLNGFFGGNKTTLTSGLEQSRNMLKQYFAQVNNETM